MSEIGDFYKTLKNPTEVSLFKDKGSKFYGYAFPIKDEEEIKEYLTAIKKEHHAAQHWCYAWRLGVNQPRTRANDDGEPSNSAGAPILGQIIAADVTNVLVIVVRYFGGVKLGVGGLIRAYKSSAQLAFENATIVEKRIVEKFQLVFDYEFMDKIMRVIKQQNLKVISLDLQLRCKLILAVKKSQFETVKNQFEKMHQIQVKSC